MTTQLVGIHLKHFVWVYDKEVKMNEKQRHNEV